ncbi:hypothetical protein KUTeg_022389 [Tegillarca granosa]|uniref:Uncharacterized protein n=1 Tax=Tegillarca granosa TaxID=220873 RepID=A0ABQ9EBN6_TEGGR|nr:hypothetical protein KUTeg_022389 [Tegillarca granosa]
MATCTDLEDETGKMGLYEFLQKRGVSEEAISSLKSEGIDENVIDHLSEDELSKYLSKRGDRIAARNFCVQPTQMSFKKNTLFDKIKRKFGSRKDQHLIGNTNAAKSTRLVELGWLDFDEKDKCYKQVKTKSGGGTRSVKVDKEANRDDILTLCQEKFFPNGMSKRGIISEFEITLRDFQQCEVSDRSIGQMYEKTGIRMLRFYLYTKRKNTLKQNLQQDDSTDEENLSKPTYTI